MTASPHTKGTWRQAGGSGRMAYSGVVTDEPIPEHSDPREIDYYGGYLIAESITPNNVHLIAAAPDLYDFVATLENDDGCIPAWLWEKREALLKKARGEEASPFDPGSDSAAQQACPHCPKKFVTDRSLRQHIQDAHQ